MEKEEGEDRKRDGLKLIERDVRMTGVVRKMQRIVSK